MIIPTDTLVLILDGRKSLFLRNRGTATSPRFEVEARQENENPPSHLQGSPIEGGDPHQQEEDRFAADMAAELHRRVLVNDFEKLVVVAPPRTLGVLRAHYDYAVTMRLLGEIPKDLTRHPLPDIAAALAG